MLPLHHTQSWPLPWARGGPTARCPRPVRRERRVPAPETVNWRKGGEVNAQGLRAPVFETAASANWATGARGASGGQRSRNLRDVDAALCRLSYAGLVGSGGFEPPSPVYQTGARNPCATIRRVGPQRFELWSACYKQAALTVELQAEWDWWVGEDSHLYSNA